MNSVISNKPVLYLTCDIEWTPEFVIEEVLDAFADYGLPLTPFAVSLTGQNEIRFE